MREEATTTRRDATHRGSHFTGRETRVADRDFAFRAPHALPAFRFYFANPEKINRKPGKIEHLVSHRKQRTGTQINRKLSEGPRFPFSHYSNPPLAALKPDPGTAPLRPTSRPQSHFFAPTGTSMQSQFPVTPTKQTTVALPNPYKFEGSASNALEIFQPPRPYTPHPAFLIATVPGLEIGVSQRKQGTNKFLIATGTPHPPAAADPVCNSHRPHQDLRFPFASIQRSQVNTNPVRSGRSRNAKVGNPAGNTRLRCCLTCRKLPNIGMELGYIGASVGQIIAYWESHDRSHQQCSLIIKGLSTYATFRLLAPNVHLCCPVIEGEVRF
jgi:hypothetical protein